MVPGRPAAKTPAIGDTTRADQPPTLETALAMKRIVRVALPVIAALSLVLAGSSATLAASKGGNLKNQLPDPIVIAIPSLPPAS